MDFPVVVTGVAHSGTSLMMKMLELGGVPVAEDLARNPLPRYPFGVMEVRRRNPTVEKFGNVAVKAIPSMFIRQAPPTAKIIIMVRDPEQIVKGRASMVRPGTTPPPPLERMVQQVRDQYLVLRNAIDETMHPHIEVQYDDCFDKTAEVCKAIADFLCVPFDGEAAAKAVVPAMYVRR